jgi:hypothetical protein
VGGVRCAVRWYQVRQVRGATARRRGCLVSAAGWGFEYLADYLVSISVPMS